MMTNSQFYANLLAFHLAQGNADDMPGDDEFTSFSDCYKSDWGIRPRGGWSRRRICEYFMQRPEYGYADDGTPLDTAEDLFRETQRLADSEEAFWRTVEASMDEDEPIDPFDYQTAFRRNRPSRAQFVRAVQA